MAMKKCWWKLAVLLMMPALVLAEEPLEQRVQQYWTARADNDAHTVFKLESAARPGGWLTPDQYKRVLGLPVRAVKILGAEINGDQATVKIQGEVAVGSLGWMPQTLTDEWLRIEGEWYHKTPDR